MSSNRKYLFIGILLFIGVLVLSRLFSLQLSSNKFYLESVKNASNEITLYPDRGIIYDRNGKLLVYNDIVYDLAVVKRKVPKNWDTMALLKILKMDTTTFKKKMAKIRNYSVPYTFIKDMSADIYTCMHHATVTAKVLKKLQKWYR